jgi:hypothetical protein
MKARACALVALLSLLAFAARSSSRTQPGATAETFNAVGPQTSGAARSRTPDAEAAAANVRIVEVPVVQERVVTRVVYVERKARRGAGTAAALASQRDGAARDGEQSPGAASSYFTRVDMEDFQPADEMKIRIVRKGKGDEK